MNDKEHFVQIEEHRSDKAASEHDGEIISRINHEISPVTVTRTNADPKLSYLDGLRGILCLIVVLSHALLMGKTAHSEHFSIFFLSWMQHSPLRLLVAGEFAVAGFFVLSGYVLVRRYFENIKETKILLSGLIRRFPRLFIPSTVSLLIYFAILHFRPIRGFNECHQVGENSVDIESVNIGYVVLNSFGQYFWMPALYTIQWTMQVEFIFSIVIYALAYLLTRSFIFRFRLFVHAFLILILPIVWIISNSRIPKVVHYTQPFLFGLLLSDLDGNGYLNCFHSIRLHWSIVINSLLILITLYCGSYPIFNTNIVNGNGTIWSPLGWMFGWFWISIGGFSIIFLSLISKSFQYFLSTKPIHFLGKISFGIYVIHYIILCLLDASFIKWAAPHIGRDLATVLGLLIFAMPCIFFFAYGFYCFVDGPAVQISHWIYFFICKHCFILKKRPQPIQTHVWTMLSIITLISIILSSIPMLDKTDKCNNHTIDNTTIFVVY